MTDNTLRFDHKAQNYEKYRPHYPGLLLPYIRETIHLTPEHTIADIGSGTGISTEIFLKNGNQVYAIEPNADMRTEAEKKLSHYSGFHSIHATAEHTTLPDHSIDVVTSGQAFHWFNPEACKKEFSRIGSPALNLVLFWNIRRLDTPFEKAYEQLLIDFGTDYLNVGHKKLASKERVALFFGNRPYSKALLPNRLKVDYATLKGRLLSTSYTPEENSPAYKPMLEKLEKLFETYQEDGKVPFNYETEVYCGKY